MTEPQRDQEKLGKPYVKKEGIDSSLKTVITPGRAPAEGPDTDMEDPTHERWEEHTPERDPAEG